MKNRLMFSLLLLAVSVPAAFANEGMWLPQQVPVIAGDMKNAGIKIDPATLSDLTGDPMGAVVSLGGCTASFVSPQGLVVTNHHCAYGSLQFNSTPQRDLIENGFLAKTPGEELPAAPGSRVLVTTGIEDVTDRVMKGVNGQTSDLERAKLIDDRRNELVSECEKAGGVRCSVSSFFEGSKYFRITQMEIRDVRLVYSPALGVGNFGGETDNWMWPRHTGDFSFLRAYVGTDGKPAPYSKDNVPFQPKHWLKVATEPMNDGDFVLVAGYPGRTFRYRTAAEVENAVKFTIPATIRYAKEANAILEAEGKRGRNVAIAAANTVKGNANTMKKLEGEVEAFKDGRILASRQKREADLNAWVAAHPEEAKKYGSVLTQLNTVDQKYWQDQDRSLLLAWMTRNSSMLSQATRTWRLAEEKSKKAAERAEGYRERDMVRFRETLDRSQKNMERGIDRAMLRYFFNEATKLPATRRVKSIDAALAATGEKDSAKAIEKALDAIFSSTKIDDLETRRAMMDESTKQLAARNDSFLRFASALVSDLRADEKSDREYAGAVARVRPLYFEALTKVAGGALAPDANSTLRITYGNVKGYSPRDGVFYVPQTTVAGVIRKNRGAGEFNAPKALIAAATDPKLIAGYVDKTLGDVPVDFLSTVDTTGGNSGSPTLNAKGELCGLLFDGNWESLGSDYQFEDYTRSIHVDAQYMRWVMDSVDQAHNLLHEMGLPIQTP